VPLPLAETLQKRFLEISKKNIHIGNIDS